MPMTLSDKHVSVKIFDTLPQNPEAPTVAEWDAATEVSDKMAFNNFALGPTGSSAVSDPAVNGDPNNAFGQSAYSGTLTPFRYLDNDGVPEADDTLWPLVKEKGTPLIVGIREGAAWDAAGKVGQEVSLYEGTTDDPQPSDRQAYVKYSVPFAVKRAWQHKALTAGA
mgnify:CR=1 FL=1